MSEQDALMAVALELLLETSVALEQTLDTPDMTVLRAMLALAREESAVAMRELVMMVQFTDNEVRILQDRARRYDSLVGWMKRIITDGKDAEQALKRLRADRNEEFMSLVFGDDENETGAQD